MRTLALFIILRALWLLSCLTSCWQLLDWTSQQQLLLSLLNLFASHINTDMLNRYRLLSLLDNQSFLFQRNVHLSCRADTQQWELEYHFQPELSMFPSRSRLWLIKWVSCSPPACSRLLLPLCFCSKRLSTCGCTSSFTLLITSFFGKTLPTLPFPTCIHREFLLFFFFFPCSLMLPPELW